MFKLFLKILLAIGAVFAVFATLQYLDNQRSDYIEIYNDNDDLDGDYY